MDYRNCKNIIFDLGGVIINIDYSLTEKAFQKLGLKDFSQLFTQHQQTDVFDRWDKGTATHDEFRKEVRKHLSPQVTDQEIDHAWNQMLLDIPKERLDLLLELKKTHRTFLLSNINFIHVDAYHCTLKNAHGHENLSDFFEKAYYSCDMGMRKPDTEIFEFVVNTHKLKKEETLFIDDTLQHIEGARKAGLIAHHLKKPQTIMELLFS